MNNKMEEIVKYCEQYGYIFQGSEIYGGLANTWDYGPLGSKLKNNIKEARTKKKLSQAALADLVGVSRNTISSIETGQFNPTAKLALLLCFALEKKFEDLFYF